MKAWAYCGKDEGRREGPLEHGLPPASKAVKGDTKERNKLILEYGLSKAIEDGLVPIDRAHHVQKGINLYHGLKSNPVTQDILHNEWHWGPTGTGKSRPLREKYPDAYIKDTNMWWDNYQGEETVIIEDLGPKMINPQKMKVWGDHYPFAAEGKGYSMRIRPKRILVTSNWTIEECYPEPQDYTAIRRRFAVHHHPGSIV